jgi:hypothetical protein
MDELPVNGVGKERVNVPVVRCAGGSKQRQVLPVTNAWHQLDPQEVGEAKDGGTLALGIGMERLRLNIRGILQQAIENVDGFPDPAGDEVAKQRDVGRACRKTNPQ